MLELKQFFRAVRFFLYTATVEAWRETRRFHQIQKELMRARDTRGS